jgi:hypothetical protein
MLGSVLCLVSKVFWPFHVAEYTVIGVVYLDTLDEFLFPIFVEDGPNGMLLQQNEVLPNFHVTVRA